MGAPPTEYCTDALAEHELKECELLASSEQIQKYVAYFLHTSLVLNIASPNYTYSVGYRVKVFSSTGV